MPAKMATGGLAGKLNKKAFESHKNDETVYSGGGECPAGIESGVAQLVECKFDQYKEGDMKGQYFFYAAGVVVTPKIHDGVPVLGLRTSIREPLCDTPNRSRKTQDEHIAWVLNELRKLGVDTSELGVDDLEATAAALKEAGPHFRFRTWKGEATKEYPNPRTNHQWQGIRGLEDFVPEDETADAVVEEDAADGDEEEVEEAPKKTAAKKKAVAKKQPEPEPEEEEEDSEDLDTLAESADDNDEDAAVRLTELATAAGITEKKIESAKNWKAVVKMIRDASPAEEEDTSDEGEEESDSEEESADPEVGEIWMYKPHGSKKAVECEILSVNADNETVTLKNLDTNKTIMDTKNPKKKAEVPFSALSEG